MVWFAYVANPRVVVATRILTLTSNSEKQVQCGSVYVTSDDTAQQVTNTIVTGSTLAGRKKRSSKYTVAIGTTHGHVQAFLEDTDIVLTALDSCSAEEKCLMLIKRPKKSSKQMLKAHSWANLSVSDTHLYRQLDGSLHPSDVKNDVKKHKSRWWRKEDGSSSTSGSSVGHASGSDLMSPTRRGSETTWREDINSRVFVPIPSSKGPKYNKNAMRERSESHREINNNSNYAHPGKSMDRSAPPSAYYSCTDIRTLPMVSESDDDEGRIGNDQLYSHGKASANNGNATNGDQVFRAHSLGDLTTGLTLSVVGQRKADSMLNISTLPGSDKRPRKRMPGGRGDRRHTEINGNIAEDPVQEDLASANEADRSSQQSRGSEQGRLSSGSVSSRERTPLKGRRSLPHVPVSEASERIKRFTELMKARMALHSSASHSTASMKSVTPQYSHSVASAKSVTPQYSHSVASAKSVTPQYSHSVASAKSVTPQYSHSANSAKSVTPQYSHSVASAKSVTPQYSHSVASAKSVTPSDHEVSNMFLSSRGEMQERVHKKYPQYHSREHSKTLPNGLDTASHKQMFHNDGNQSNQSRHGHTLSVHSTPQLPGDRSTDSGQTTLTSHSYGSTMDSGYTTNNDCDTDTYATALHSTNQKMAAMNLKNQPVRNYSSKYSETMSNGNYYELSGANGHTRIPAGDRQFPEDVTSPRVERLPSRSQSVERLAGVRRLDQSYPGHVPVVSGFRPVKEDEMYQQPYDDCQPAGKYHSPPSRCPPVHYGSHPNLNVNPRDGSYREPGAMRENNIRGDSRFRVKPESLKLGEFPSAGRSNSEHVHRHWGDSRIQDEHRHGWDPSQSTEIHPKVISEFNPGMQCASSDLHLNYVPCDDPLSYATLPGNWKFNGGDENGFKQSASKYPTLYQLAQVYSFHGTKVELQKDVSLEDSLQLKDLVIELPALRDGSSKESPVLSTPQGQYATLGGPGSAFRPVKATGMTSFSMVAVHSFMEKIVSPTGSVETGDLLIEVNGRLILGADAKIVLKTLEIIQGEIIMTVARIKPETDSSTVKMDQVVKEIDYLRAQIAQRDTQIKDLRSVVPWKEERSEKVVNLTQNKLLIAEVEISDDEFIV